MYTDARYEPRQLLTKHHCIQLQLRGWRKCCNASAIVMRTATGLLTAHACDVTVVNGYKAPCPLREFVEGCVFQCGDTANCEEVRSGADTTRLCCSLHHIHCSTICCMAACTSDCTLHHVQCMNNTEPILITPTAEACQAACAKHQQCAAFQWVGVGDNESATARHHQCSFKCAGAVTPGRTQCSLGHKVGTAGGSYICGPKHNDSSAPAPPGPPPPTKPTGPPCPVPFGLTGEYVSVATLCFCYILASAQLRSNGRLAAAKASWFF